MPRLLDDIRAAGRFQKPWFVKRSLETEWAKYALAMWKQLVDPELPVLLIDNVAEYYFTGTDQEYWSLETDFPNLAPPFPVFWAEHRLTKTIHSTDGDTDISQFGIHNGRVGMLFNTVDPAHCKGEGEMPAGTRWLLMCDTWIDYGARAFQGMAQGPGGPTFLCLDDHGRLLEKPWMQSFCDESHSEMMRNAMGWFNPVFLAISFLHCKNVTIERHEVPKPLAKRYRERHGGLQPTAHHTLVIEPLKAILRREGSLDSNGLKKAMHICRGHFADYREGRGLFGKYKKLVWIPSVVRGTKGKAAPPREMEVKLS